MIGGVIQLKMAGRRRKRWGWTAGITAAAAALGVGGGLAVKEVAGPGLEAAGIRDGAVLTRAEAAEQRLYVTASDPGRVRARLDGRPVPLRRAGDRLLARIGPLQEGGHELSITAPGSLPLTGGGIERRFTVDATPPTFEFDGTAAGTNGQGLMVQASSLREPFTFTGTAEDAERVTVDGREVELDDGKFSLDFDYPPTAVRLTAYDAAGNRTDERVPVAVPHPGMRAVHVSSVGWASEKLRGQVMKMAREGRINAVQLDIKDEAGIIGYNSQVPLARKIGATRGHYDPRKVIQQLHQMDIQVIGRIVAFRDPVLGKASWQAGKRDRLVQTSDGKPYGAHYGPMSFTNHANPEVRQYNMGLAVEAARLGFDDILYDYVRRPDGPLSSMRFPGLKGSVEDSIARFMGETRRAIRPHGAFLGACVYGIAATRPKEIGQHIPKIGEHADYVAPMVYPSHWGPGEFGLENPGAEPYKTVLASVQTFHKVLAGTSTQVIPWLQDFSMGESYGTAEVRAQIDASAKAGSPSFLLWNAANRYHAGALEPRCTADECEGA